MDFVNDFICEANTCQQFIKAIDKWVHSEGNHLKDWQKAQLAILISEVEFNLFEGGRDDLNLLLFLEKLKIVLAN